MELDTALLWIILLVGILLIAIPLLIGKPLNPASDWPSRWTPCLCQSLTE